MSKNLDKNADLKILIEEVKELLSEIKDEQTIMKKEAEKHHKVTMKKLDKLREFDEIADMTNVVFEKRFSDIENALLKVVRQ